MCEDKYECKRENSERYVIGFFDFDFVREHLCVKTNMCECVRNDNKINQWLVIMN